MTRKRLVAFSERRRDSGTRVPKVDADFGTRINEVVTRVGSDEEAAQIAGVSTETIRRYKNLTTGLKFEPLLRLAQHTGVSLQWLATGEGPMILREMRDLASIDEPGEDYVALPRYDVQAAAGTGQLVETEHVVDWIHFRRDWLRRTLGVSPAELSIIEAVGDSMSPTISDGDLLLIDMGEPRLRGEGIYVLAVDDALIVKRVAIKPAGGLVISSDNSRYHATSMEISREELDKIRLVGRVVWVGSRL